MRRDELGDLIAFLAVCEERSFTRAAARIGTSQSSLSHTVKRLEERMGIRLLTRTTRNVSPTEAGEQLAETLRPAFDNIESTLDTLNELRQKPAGTIRVTSSHDAAMQLLMPVVDELLAEHPDLNIEISVDSSLVDIVKHRFDAGVRLGERVDKDMIAVRIGPDVRMAVVGAPDYFADRPTPETPYDLTDHICINLRLNTYGDLYTWEFEKEGRPLNVRVSGQFTSNDVEAIIDAAVRGRGLACIPDYLVEDLVAKKKLVRVLADWCPPFPGFHLYYPSRREGSRAFRLFVDHLRKQAKAQRRST